MERLCGGGGRADWGRSDRPIKARRLGYRGSSGANSSRVDGRGVSPRCYQRWGDAPVEEEKNDAMFQRPPQRDSSTWENVAPNATEPMGVEIGQNGDNGERAHRMDTGGTGGAVGAHPQSPVVA